MNEKRLLEKAIGELVRRYGEQAKGVKRSVRKLEKSVATRFVAVATCVSRLFLKRSSIEISEQNYFKAHMHID